MPSAERDRDENICKKKKKKKETERKISKKCKGVKKGEIKQR